jgi:hypothetical protein
MRQPRNKVASGIPSSNALLNLLSRNKEVESSTTFKRKIIPTMTRGQQKLQADAGNRIMSLLQRDIQGLDGVRTALQGLLRGDVSDAVGNRANALADMIQTPAITAFEELELPRLREAYGGGGSYWGGARAHAEARARRDFMQGLEAQRGQIGLQVGQESMQGVLQALGMAPNLAMMEDPSIALALEGSRALQPYLERRMFENVLMPKQTQRVTYS